MHDGPGHRAVRARQRKGLEDGIARDVGVQVECQFLKPKEGFFERDVLSSGLKPSAFNTGRSTCTEIMRCVQPVALAYRDGDDVIERRSGDNQGRDALDDAVAPSLQVEHAQHHHVGVQVDI